MSGHMRTTVRLPDTLMRQAKRTAQERGQTLAALIESGVRHEVSIKNRPRAKKVELPVFRGGSGLMPGVDLNNSRALLDIMEGLK